MYRFLLFLHVYSLLAFLLIHGVNAAVMFAVRREREAERVRGLLLIRDFAERWMGIPLGVLLLSGIAMGFLGRWWSQGWIWVSIVVFVAILFSMSGFGRLYHERLWHAIDPKGHAPPTKKDRRNPAPATPEELAALLSQGRPTLLALVGGAGLAVILWLMMFKPF